MEAENQEILLAGRPKKARLLTHPTPARQDGSGQGRRRGNLATLWGGRMRRVRSTTFVRAAADEAAGPR